MQYSSNSLDKSLFFWYLYHICKTLIALNICAFSQISEDWFQTFQTFRQGSLLDENIREHYDVQISCLFQSLCKWHLHILLDRNKISGVNILRNPNFDPKNIGKFKLLCTEYRDACNLHVSRQVWFETFWKYFFCTSVKDSLIWKVGVWRQS